MLQKMGAEVERTAPDTIVVEGQPPPARRRPPGHGRSHRGGHVRRRRRGDRRRRDPRGARHATTWVRSSTSSRDIGVPVACGRDTIEVHATRHRVARSGHATSRPRRIRASPRTCSHRRRCCSPRPNGTASFTRRSSRTGWSGWRAAHARRAGRAARHTSRGNRRSRRRCTARRSRWATCAPAHR